MQEYTLHRVFGRNYDLSPAYCVSEETLGLNVPTALLAGADEVIQ